MDLLFHTIAVEPARWTARKTSRALTELLPAIREAGFTRIEIFEPHLATANAAEIKSALAGQGITAEILSSYLNLNPAETADDVFRANVVSVKNCLETFGLERMRLFPGPKMDPNDRAGVKLFTKRLETLLDELPSTEVLLETHDASLADDPDRIVQIVQDINAPNLGLLYQPTVFKAAEALEQFAIQQPFIRHIHLQNRHPDLSFARLKDGVIPWQKILAQIPPGITGSLEFVPSGICSIEEFDLAAALEEAKSEAAYIAGIWG